MVRYSPKAKGKPSEQPRAWTISDTVRMRRDVCSAVSKKVIGMKIGKAVSFCKKRGCSDICILHHDTMVTEDLRPLRINLMLDDRNIVTNTWVA